MNLRCTVGLHKWLPRVRRLDVPRREQLMLPVIPSLFAGPPYLAPVPGAFYTVHWAHVGDQCARCKRRRA